uniref:Centrosomal protein of 135 kDa n=1 Tax=Denticeps clupeoides TaxID=299321 RepID=A0AAY4D472_9TELE
MSSNAERRFVNLRKRLDQLGYRQPLGIESLPLVEKLFSDLVHTTESLRNAKLSAGKTEKESRNLDALLEPYKTENSRLVRENNELHLGLLKLREEKDKLKLKAFIRKLDHETSDLKFLNNQYVHKVRSLEKESMAKTERIQQLQEKNMQAVVQTPGGKKRSIPFRRQRMQIDELLPPPSGSTSSVVMQPDDPYIADLLQVADDRIQELQRDVTKLQLDIEHDIHKFCGFCQVEERDKEIERLNRALDGGRPYDVISLESQNISNEKVIAHLNLQIEYLQETNRSLEQKMQGLQQKRQHASSEVADLSARNQELCKELTHIDELAHQLERDKEHVLETADVELLEAKVLFTTDHPNVPLLTFRELVMELERMRMRYGICGKDRSPSRLDAFVKSLEEERDYYRLEAEKYRKTRGGSGSHRSPSHSPLTQAVREKNELQTVLLGFEKQMEDIQANVKALTAERDHLNVQYQQAREELRWLRRESASPTDVPQKLREEREQAEADLRRMASERDSLRERLKVHYAICDQRKKAPLLCTCDVCICGLRLLQEQMDKSLSDVQHRLSVKTSELMAAHQKIDRLEERIGDMSLHGSSQKDEVSILQAALSALDHEKDMLQDTVDQKTERMVQLQEELHRKEKTLTDMRLNLSEMENSLDQLKGVLSSREREISSLRRQLNGTQEELAAVGKDREITLRENRRLQDDLATMTRENQAVHAEMEEALHEKDELKMRVHSYISEVARMENLMAAKEQENRELLERFCSARSEAEDWEQKLQQAEGLSSSVRLELLSSDAERRHLRERAEHQEREIQEHMSALQAYEAQVCSMARAMSRLEEQLQAGQVEKSTLLDDLASVRELCVKLDSSKEVITRQLTGKSMDLERVLGELEDVRSEAELLKKQLTSEKLTVRNLEALLSTNRQKEFQTQLSSTEKEQELKVLKDRLALADSKTASHAKEVSQLRGKVSQLQTEMDVLKRQLTTERFERERAFQEMRKQGVSFSSLRSSSPHSASLSSCPLTPDRSSDRSPDKNVSFKE